MQTICESQSCHQIGPDFCKDREAGPGHGVGGTVTLSVRTLSPHCPGSEAYQCVSLLISENKNYDSIIYVKIQLYGDDLLVIFPYKYMVGS